MPCVTRPGAPPVSVLLLLPYAYDTAPSQRFRIEQWSPHLRAAGIRVTQAGLHSLEEQRRLHAPGSSLGKAMLLLRGLVRRLMQLRLAPGHDVIWLHRTALLAGPPILERLLAKSGHPVVYEFDDAIWMPHTARANARWSWMKFANKTGEICRLASHVVTGNDYLADYARQFASNVSVIPTTVDTDEYRPVESYERTDPFVVGWSGSATTQPHLELAGGALARLAARRPIKLMVIGAPNVAIPHVAAEACEFEAHRQVERLRQFHAGIMPLPDEDWARGKCGLKALEYMACGVPVVTSPVGVNSEIIEHETNGLLVTRQDEWVEALDRLAGDPSLRERLGRAGRRTVERNFSREVQASRVERLLRAVAAGEPVPPAEEPRAVPAELSR